MNKFLSKLKFGLGFDLVIILLAFIIGMPRMAGALSNVETDTTQLGGASTLTVAIVTGTGFAALVALSAMYNWSTFSLVNNTTRQKSAFYKNRYILVAFVAIQLVMEVLLVWPTLTANLIGMDVKDVLEANGLIALWTLLAAALPVIVVASVATTKAFRMSLPDANAKKANKSGAFSTSGRAYECGACGRKFESANAFSGHFKDAKHQRIVQLVSNGSVTKRNEDGKVSFYSNRTDALVTIQNVGQQENGHKDSIPKRTF